MMILIFDASAAKSHRLIVELSKRIRLAGLGWRRILNTRPNRTLGSVCGIGKAKVLDFFIMIYFCNMRAADY